MVHARDEDLFFPLAESPDKLLIIVIMDGDHSCS